MNPNSELNNAIQVLWEKINSISSTLSDYNQQRFTLRDEKKQLERQLSQIKLENDDAQVQIEQYMQNISSANDRIKSLEETLSNKDNIISDLRKIEQEMSQLNMDFTQLKIKYDTSLVQNANLENEVGKMKEELQLFELMKEEKKGLELQIKDLTMRSQDFEYSQQEVVRKNRDIYEKNALIKELKDTISMLESKLFAFDKMKEEIEQLQEQEVKSIEEKASLKKQISQLISQEEIEKKKYEERIEELEQRLAMLEADNTEKRNAFVLATEKYEEQNKAHLSLIDRHAALLVRLEDERNANSLLKENIEKLNTKIFDYLIDIQEVVNSNKRQGESVDRLKLKIAELEEQNTEIDELKATVESKNEELVKQLFELDRLEKEKAGLVDNIEIQKKSIDEYKKQLEAKLVSEATQDTLITFYSDECKRTTKELKELNAKYLELCKAKDDQIAQELSTQPVQSQSNEKADVEIRRDYALLLEKYTACKLTLDSKEDSLLQLASEKIELAKNGKAFDAMEYDLAKALEELTACKLTLDAKEDSLLQLASEKIELAKNGEAFDAMEYDLAKALEELTACKLTLDAKEDNLLQLANEKIALAKNSKISRDSDAIDIITQEKNALLAEMKELKKQNSASEKEAKEIQHELKTKLDEQMQKSSELSKNVSRMRVQMQANIDKLDKHNKVRAELIEFIENYINIIKQK